MSWQTALVILWDTASWREAVTLIGHNESVEDLAFTADGHLLATTSVDGTIRLWDARP